MKEKRQNAIKARIAARLGLLARISDKDNSDVDGSYTGTSKDGSPPTQDADDL
ncbi:MAG: hypothetical protein FWF69_01205 [Firmicutes bacterium]|nr:hypothetical protein [Bacillota bacterium]